MRACRTPPRLATALFAPQGPPRRRRLSRSRERRAPQGQRSTAPAALNPVISPNPEADIDDPNLSEKERVITALEQAGWVQAKAARILGMTPRQIAYRIQTLNIEVKQF